MDQPLCLSKSFVNKQNVRSFANIVPAKLLKKENSKDFLLNILQDKETVSQIAPELRNVLFIVRENLREKSKQDFRNYFPAEKNTVLEPVAKEKVLNNCSSALREIIPKDFYGNNHNAKIFQRLIKTVIYSMKGEHVIFSKMVVSWNFTASPWKYIQSEIAINILERILLWININIISPIICLNFYVTTTKLTPDEYKLNFFWKSEWQSFYDKKVSELIQANTIKIDMQHTLGKKTRRSLNLGEQLKRKTMKMSVPKLYLILKDKDECRPIVKYRNDHLSVLQKNKIISRLNLLKTLTGKPSIKIESKYLELYQDWTKFGQPQLYFVKADLTNAFGSIAKELLMKILAEKHVTFQKTEKNMILKRNIAQTYRDFILELHKPLLIRAGSTIYTWNKGLVQGYKYSPALSELYYTYMDAQYFTELLNNDEEANIMFLMRVVDDYLFVTDSLTMANKFLSAISNYENVNYNKTLVNFDHPTIRKSMTITFLGYSYNTTTLQVSRANNVLCGQMCYKIAFTSAIQNIHKFLENRIGQSSIQINGHLFNFHYNCEEFVWRHVFTTMCLSANKFCTILAIVCEEWEIERYLALYKRRVTVKLCNTIIETLQRNIPTGLLFIFCINHFRFMSWKALLLCAKNTPKCNRLVPLISNEMAKCNCLFGKWREHASVITKDGHCKHAAVREVCSRSDLRVVFNSFSEPPTGFKFYNNKCRCSAKDNVFGFV